MKKKVIGPILCFIFIIAVVFGTLYVIDHKRMDNNEPVVFSTWGAKYAPPEEMKEISLHTAVENVKAKLDKKSIDTITNYDNPKIEETMFKTKPPIYCYIDESNVIGKSLYKITFNTTLDGLLGPLVFYVDKVNGEIIGADYRE